MRISKQGIVFVSGAECCDLFESSPVEALVPLRECWFCRWSEFRLDTEVFLQESACRNPKNLMKINEEMDKL